MLFVFAFAFVFVSIFVFVFASVSIHLFSPLCFSLQLEQQLPPWCSASNYLAALAGAPRPVNLLHFSILYFHFEFLFQFIRISVLCIFVSLYFALHVIIWQQKELPTSECMYSFFRVLYLNFAFKVPQLFRREI